LPALWEDLEAAHVLRLFPGFDRAVEVGDTAGEVGALGQEGLACRLRALEPGHLGDDLAPTGL
jgi:hypothetical protein